MWLVRLASERLMSWRNLCQWLHPKSIVGICSKERCLAAPAHQNDLRVTTPTLCHRHYKGKAGRNVNDVPLPSRIQGAPRIERAFGSKRGFRQTYLLQWLLWQHSRAWQYTGISRATQLADQCESGGQTALTRIPASDRGLFPPAGEHDQQRRDKTSPSDDNGAPTGKSIGKSQLQ